MHCLGAAPFSNGAGLFNPMELPTMPRLQPLALVIEDDELVSLSIRRLLEHHQLKVVTASDGREVYWSSDFIWRFG